MSRLLLILLAVVFAVGQLVPIWLGMSLLRDDGTRQIGSVPTPGL